MNKYLEALEIIKESFDEGEFQYNYDEINELRELVNKATPKKPIPLFIPLEYLPFRCPNCKENVNNKKSLFKYCPNCGQCLDWSEDEN